jgi:MinD superfamily P-loop ATPase
MKQMVILSGKGGTGKTTVAAALAHLASQEARVVLADADVDAANLELVLAPTQREMTEFHGGVQAVIDPDVCISCGTCADVCRFDAIREGDVYRVDHIGCEGCAACYYQCPADAIKMVEAHSGRWFCSDTRFGPLFHAHLFAGQENSGKLVTAVKQQARLWALDAEADYLLVDGPPGIGCPVISAISGADMVLLVTEPTISGAHDVERALATARHFGVPALACINKADLNPRRADEIVAACADIGVPVVGRVPYDNVVTEAMVHGQPVTAYSNGAVSAELRALWGRVQEALQ